MLYEVITTIKATNPQFGGLVDAVGRHDVYSMVVLGYQNVLISIAYIAAMVLLGYHRITSYNVCYTKLLRDTDCNDYTD